MKIKDARQITGYEKLPYYEYEHGGNCDLCGEKLTRHNSGNEKKVSFEYDEYISSCNKCVKAMAKAVNDGIDVIVGMF